MRWKQRKRNRSGRRRRVRDRARKGLALLPSLLTLGNLMCGFFALVRIATVQWEDGVPKPEDAFQIAAVAILVGMIFDMLDGRVARMTQSTSDFGGQLDSLADAVTFGVVPGVMVAMLHSLARWDPAFPFWSRMAWVFGAAFACGAVIRLARFNTENAHDEESHLSFKGLPSPAAAGVIATLVLVHYYLGTDQAGEKFSWTERGTLTALSTGLLNALPFITLALGYLMVSQFRYVHVANKFLKGRKPPEYLAGAIFAAVLVALFPEVVAALAFCGFALSGPAVGFRRWMLAGSKARSETTALEQAAAPPSPSELLPPAVEVDPPSETNPSAPQS